MSFRPLAAALLALTLALPAPAQEVMEPDLSPDYPPKMGEVTGTLNGRAVKSCSMLAVQAQGADLVSKGENTRYISLSKERNPGLNLFHRTYKSADSGKVKESTFLLTLCTYYPIKFCC